MNQLKHSKDAKIYCLLLETAATFTESTQGAVKHQSSWYQDQAVGVCATDFTESGWQLRTWLAISPWSHGSNTKWSGVSDKK